MPDKKQLLERYWHNKAFRPCQEEIIDSVLQGRDTLALLPTGGGKSLCYQLPTLMMDGMCLVVSPLISLMKDQVQQLNSRHLSAACLYAGLGGSEVMAVLNNAVCGRLKFLYVSPERLRTRVFIEHFRRMKVSLIAVDEAHCVSQWGYDFRPPYLQIAEIRQYQPSATMVALTATATPAVVEDIVHQLQMRSCQVFRTSFARPNVTYSVVHTGDKKQRLLRVCQSEEGSGIVYCGSRRGCESVSAFLGANGVSASYYHAGLTPAERDRRQEMWMKGECRVMVATSAFGMGIDKAEVRFVVHIEAPSSLEAYFQEAGRVGRDGNAARAILLCSDDAARRLDESLAVEFPPVKHIRNAYKALCNYYRIPMGSGGESSHEFKKKEICSMYNLDMREFYSCCRFLEREGLIALDDADKRQSTLLIPVSRDELYRFQVDHMRSGDMLQNIIRLYPGLFLSRIPIDERRIASRSMSDAGEVRRILMELNEMHVVEYHPASDKPSITFTSERVDENAIYFGEQNYYGLLDAARRRVDAVKAYLSNDKECRSRQLLAYFGESAEDCGRCDVCMARKQSDVDVEQAVVQAVSQTKLTVSGLCELLGEQNIMGVEEAVRDLLDRGELHLDRNLLLSLS